jgi:hypothetical protein
MAILTDAINGITKLVTGETPTSSEHLWSTVAISAGVTVAAGMFTRKRVEQGKEPIGGFIL